MEFEYYTECEACGVEVEVLVLGETETPQHCPMCGFSSEYEEMVDDD